MALPRGSVTAQAGLLVLDKPQGRTSHDLVAAVRRLAATKKVGHAGTLDPLATGVLVLGIGQATKLLTYVVGADKTYEATIRLGASTITDDAEGEVTAAAGAENLSLAQIEAGIAQLRGEIMQVPSAVSAIKINGKRSYARVRAGETVELAARPVTIHRFEILSDIETQQLEDGVTVQDLKVLVECSSGTYIRALARDLGEALGCGGHLTQLRRTQVGPFTLADAKTLPELAQAVSEDNEAEAPQGLQTLSLDEACGRYFPTRPVGEELKDLRYGRPISRSNLSGVVAAQDDSGHTVALIEDRGKYARPVYVIDPA
ncbi:tRNA pseudouridine(55) synthase TruB [Boudabousia marimammalium]|uniref:tRNA pseudouridine synthase B n=1 Tax=Boudabousia marimammalium TaxID=156892 RepID=A0A1Q5PPD3_9ACTO|nr:tRNA pseudouridine(55) synthase TruB [Boudabousia marimammalium]